jgi:flagellar export protein FliJ
MKRYSFRLGQVLRVRTIELDRAVAEVARARRDVVTASQRTAAREADYRELSQQPLGATVADLRTRRMQQDLAADAILKARHAAHLAEQVVDARLADWAEADRKVALLEQLDERSQARHAAEVLLDDQKVLDDLVTSRQGRSS